MKITSSRSIFINYLNILIDFGLESLLLNVFMIPRIKYMTISILFKKLISFFSYKKNQNTYTKF